MVKYSVVVPVYNSSQYLTKLVDSIAQVLVSEKHMYEIILVNDASTDRSMQVLQTIAKGNSYPIRIIDLTQNFGQYTATLVGLSKAVGAVVITIDADFTPEPSYIKTMMHYRFAYYDLLYGNFIVKRNLYRQLGGCLFNNMVKLSIGKNISQSGSSFRLIKRELLVAVLEKIFNPLLLDVYLLQSASDVRFVQLPEQMPSPTSHSFLKLAGITLLFAKAALSKALFKQGRFLPDI
ncbi:MAG: glycosyltransferase, partial [Bacteroidetes bacterium]|nr:glycosyltransferase [Bacteroidota bacterium]